MCRYIIHWPLKYIDGQIQTSNDGPRPEVHHVENSERVDPGRVSASFIMKKTNT